MFKIQAGIRKFKRIHKLILFRAETSTLYISTPLAPQFFITFGFIQSILILYSLFLPNNNHNNNLIFYFF